MHHRAAVVAVAAVLAALLVAAPASAHAPSVVGSGNETPATAHSLEDPTLSRAIGSTLLAPGEADWYRMELRAGDPLIVEVTAPDAAGGIATAFTLLGPGLPSPASDRAAALAAAVGAEGSIEHAPTGGDREVHGGLGFIAWGGVRTEAPADGTYWIVVRAGDDRATGKYVLAPGVREEFGAEAIGGMADLVAFFAAPWPPEPGTAAPEAGDGATVGLGAVVVVGLGALLLVVIGGALSRRRRAPGPPEEA